MQARCLHLEADSHILEGFYELTWIYRRRVA